MAAVSGNAMSLQQPATSKQKSRAEQRSKMHTARAIEDLNRQGALDISGLALTLSSPLQVSTPVDSSRERSNVTSSRTHMAPTNLFSHFITDDDKQPASKASVLQQKETQNIQLTGSQMGDGAQRAPVMTEVQAGKESICQVQNVKTANHANSASSQGLANLPSVSGSSRFGPGYEKGQTARSKTEAKHAEVECVQIQAKTTRSTKSVVHSLNEVSNNQRRVKTNVTTVTDDDPEPEPSTSTTDVSRAGSCAAPNVSHQTQGVVLVLFIT